MSPALPAATLGGLTPGVRLDAGQYVALWRHLGLGPRHALLDPPDHGRTYAERDALDAAAWRRLADQGLVDARGAPDPSLADALAVLAAPACEIDLTVVTDGGRSASVAAARGALALVASDENGGLRLDPADPGDLAGAALAHLPDRRPVPGVPITVPAAPVLADHPSPGDRAAALRRAGVPRHAVDRLAAMWAHPTERVAQLGVTVRDAWGHRHRGPRVVAVLDTAVGRVVVERVPAGDRVVYRPTDRPRLRAQLADLLARHERDVAGPRSPR